MNENSEISEAAQSAQSATNTVVMPQSYVMTYTYDANNRMLTQKKAENGIDYLTKMGYDKNGNMTSRQRSSIGGPVGENTSMEVSIGTMQSNPGSESVAETFSYNVLNQMVGYQNSNGTNASYTYDATGMRTSKTVNGVEKKFYYNGMYILNEGDSTEITATNFVGLTGIEGRQNGANEMAFFMKDAHGDVVKAMDSEDFRADYEYDIWGNQTQEATNTFDNPFRYCSEYMDEESGLIYLRARYYDSNTGRFTQEDSARDGLNWYAYVGNNPIQYTVPTGLVMDGDDELSEGAQIYTSYYGSQWEKSKEIMMLV